MSSERHSRKQIIDSLPHIAWICRLDGCIEYLNEEWEAYTGFSLNTSGVNGCDAFTRVIHPEDLAASQCGLRGAQLNALNFEAKYRLRRKDGIYRWHLFRTKPLRDENGEILSCLGTATEIHVEEPEVMLRQSQESLAFALESANMGTWEINLTTNRVSCSREMFELWGLPSADGWLERKDFQQRVHPDDLETMRNAIATAIDSRGVYDTEYRIQPKPGQEKWVRSRGRVTYEEDLVTPAKFAGVVFDITQQKIAQQAEQLVIAQLEKALEELRQAVQARDTFMSIASHELKTPLSSLKLQTHLRKRAIEKGELNRFSAEKLPHLIEDDERQLNRLVRLVDDMLDVSRIQTGKLSLTGEEFDLRDMIRETLLRLQPQVESQGCKVFIETRSEVKGVWDRFRMEQVFINLLTNALKFGAGRPIQVKVRMENGRAFFSVTDEGLGIAPEDHERIFGQFERAISPDSISGLGLGLFISKKIVEAHEGSIHVESSLGSGATFSVSLPTHSSI